MALTEQPSGLVDRNLFRDVMGRFASGVTVITTHAGGANHGTTASAVSSLSMDPPMVLTCLNKTSATQAAVCEAGVFAINILGADQGDIAFQFATKSGGAKFDGVDIATGRHDVPLIQQALAHIECRVAEMVTGGTHTVFLAEVESAAATEGAPLTYFRGKFGRFETELEEATYRELRGLVLRRELPMGAPLDVDGLAARLNSGRQRIFYALTKLSTDGLVARDAHTGYRINPLTVYASDQAYDARRTVEIGVPSRRCPRSVRPSSRRCASTWRRRSAPCSAAPRTSRRSSARTARSTSTRSVSPTTARSSSSTAASGSRRSRRDCSRAPTGRAR